MPQIVPLGNVQGAGFSIEVSHNTSAQAARLLAFIEQIFLYHRIGFFDVEFVLGVREAGKTFKTRLIKSVCFDDLNRLQNAFGKSLDLTPIQIVQCIFTGVVFVKRCVSVTLRLISSCK